MIYYVIAGLVFIGLILIIYYNYFYKSSKKGEIILLTGPKKFTEDFQKEITLTDLVKNNNYLLTMGKGYGISLLWEMNISNISGSKEFNSSYNKLKPIIRFGSSPQIYYHPKKGYLSIILKYTDNPFYSNYPEIKFKEVRQQRWSKYLLIINNRHINLYVDGVLKLSQTLLNVPVLELNNITIGKINNNSLAVIKNMSLFLHPLTKKEIDLI